MNAMPMFYPFCLSAVIIAALCVNIAVRAFESKSPQLFVVVGWLAVVGVTALAVVLR